MAKSFSDRLLKIYGSLSELRTKLGGSTSSSDMLFWASTTLFLFLVVWSVTFEIDKSVNVEGDLSPLGRPIVVQNRFEGKVLELLVSSGDRVSSGQDLIIFETSADDSEFLENQLESQKLSIQLRRLVAQSKLETSFENFATDDIEFLEDQLRVLQAEVGTLQSQVKSKETTKQVLLTKISGTESQLNSLQEKFKLAEEKYRIVERLFQKGYEGQIALLESKQEMSTVEQELLDKKIERENLLSDLDIAELDIKTATLDFQRKTSQELAETKKSLELTEIRNSSLSARMSEYSIKASSDGTISRIFVENIGSVTAEGTKLLEIIPSEAPIVFYAKIPVASITDVHVGQEAKITLSTMDTRQVVPIEASVISIDPDATQEEDGSRHYSAILGISESPSDTDLVPGITGSGAILLGKRTVFMYFLEPLWQAMEGALSEA